MKELVDEFEGQFTFYGKILKDTSHFQFQEKIKLSELIKMEKKSQKPYLTN